MYQSTDNLFSRTQGALLGLACGDAVGTTVEFRPRGSFTPVTDMTGGEPFRLKPGQWTDDTSMALCLAASLIECKGFDARDQMERYCRWQEDGYLSSTGTCFDIGNTVAGALARYRRTCEPFNGSTDPHSAGNGSIMRLAPVPMFYLPNLADVIHYSAESSWTTHGAREAVDACRLFGLMIALALLGKAKEEVLFNGHRQHLPPDSLAPAIAAIARGKYRDKHIDEIQGSGYVVKSLEAALWCFLKTDDFHQAILQAANLGDDADTTAAVCGQIAGAYYGVEGIPKELLEKISKLDCILRITAKLVNQDYRYIVPKH